MKKIPTLFERKFENHVVTEILSNVMEGMEWVLNGEGIAQSSGTEPAVLS